MSSKDPALSRLFGAGYESAAGIHVTPENAYTFSAVFDAVNQLSSDTAKLPLNHHKRLKTGGSEIYDDSKLQYLLKFEPNIEMTSMVFRRTLVAHALTLKGGFAEIERDGLERPIAFHLITPDRIEPKRRERKDGLGPLEYLVDNKDWIPARNILHIHGLGYDGINGYGIIALARQTIGLALAAERFGAKYFGQGTVFGGWLETDQDLDDEQKAEIVKSITAFRAAQDSAFKILVTGMGHKFHQFESKPSESQMDESRRSQVEEVARFFRMPPYRLGVNTPGTVSYASVEAAQIDYYTGPILDWVTLIEQEINRKCISPLERRQQFVKHNVSAFLRGTIKDRFEALGIARDKGIINADEWREFEDWNPQPNGQGQLYLVQSAQVPVDKLAALIDSQIDANKAKANPPQTPPSSTDTDVAAANDRAARAEALAEDARQQAETLRNQIAAMEAVGQAQSAEVVTLREALDKQQVIAGNLTALSHDLRSRADVLETAKTETEGALRDALEAKGRAEAEAVAAAERARDAVELAEQGKRSADADAELARQDAALAKAKADELERLAADARAAAESAVSDKAQAESARLDAEQIAVEARALAAAHEAAVQELEQAAGLRAVELDTARAEAERLTQAAADTQALQAQIETMQALQEADRAKVRQDIEALTAALAQAEQERDAERQQRAEVEAQAAERFALLEQARVTEAAQAEAATRALEEAGRIAQEAIAATLREQEARAHAEAKAAELAAQAEADRLAREQAETAQAADLMVAEESERRALEAIAQAEAAALAKDEAERKAAEADAARDAIRSAELERMTAVMSAHRDLIAGSIERMARREAEKARQKQGKPETFRRWLNTYQSLSDEDLYVQILRPAVQANLAWRTAGTPDRVKALAEEKTRAMVKEHMAAFGAQMTALLDGDQEQFHVQLDRALTKWEQERAATVADAMLVEEIRYVRAQ